MELQQFDEAMEKVHFVNGSSKRDELFNSMKYREDGDPVDFLWIFTLKNGNKVGFISNNESNNEVFYGTTLSYLETNERLEVFKQVWEDLAVAN